jgi:hypothetical protein
VTIPKRVFSDGSRVRCRTCGKVVYYTRERAEDAAAKISERVKMYVYLGPCGYWHVTRKNPETFKKGARR